MKINFCLWLTLLFAVAACSTDESHNGFDANWKDGQPLSFAVISDIHFGNNVAEGPMVKVPRALKNITSHGQLDAMFVVGDLTDNGQPKEYQQLVSVFKDKSSFSNPVRDLYFVMGNHDNYSINAKANFQNCLSAFNGGAPYPLCDYRIIKGYPFIMVSVFDRANNDLADISIGTKAYPKETVEWLKKSMAKASKECPGKPIFVFTHVPPRWTCFSSWAEYENGAAWCMQTLNPVFAEYPQTIVFAGHSHYPIGDPRSIHQGANPNSLRQNYYTVINTSSTTYSEIHPAVVGEGIHPACYAYVTEGLVVNETSNGDIEIIRYDTYRNEEIAADKRWVLKAPFDGSQFVYADIRDVDDNPFNLELYNGGASPMFGDDAKLSLDISSNDVMATFFQATDDDCVFRYVINVLDAKNGTSVGKASVFSQFYLNSEMPATITCTIDGLQPKTEYYIEVNAYDSYDNESNAIGTMFSTQ